MLLDRWQGRQGLGAVSGEVVQARGRNQVPNLLPLILNLRHPIRKWEIVQPDQRLR